jgi:hypothetical protein
MHYSFFLLGFLFLCTSSSLHANIIHVPGDQSTIQAGINVASNGDTVLVMDGTYAGSGNRDITFLGKTIVVMSENGPEETIIDCEGSETKPHRGFHFHNGEGYGSVVKGFTITSGWADIGGGMLIDNSYPTITNCTFRGNSARDFGGGMYNSSNNLTVSNCRFSGNSTNYKGGGMYNWESNPTVTNCTFSGNVTIYSGGGMYNFYSAPTVINCTFSRNSADDGGGMYNYYSDPTVTNCIFWGNRGVEIFNNDSYPIVTYCNVHGGYPGEGIIDADPLFVTFHGFDYLLRRFSPCIDTGDPALEDGIEWSKGYFNGPRSDMGAYGGPGNVGWLPQ